MYSPKYVDYLDEKRIESAFYNPKSKPKTWVGIIPWFLRALLTRVHLLKEYTAASDSFDAAVFAVHGWKVSKAVLSYRKSQQVSLTEKLKKKNVIHVFGASGSGKTTLVKKIFSDLGYKLLDTDKYYWIPT